MVLKKIKKKETRREEKKRKEEGRNEKKEGNAGGVHSLGFAHVDVL
jgi:hypothetical protein